MSSCYLCLIFVLAWFHLCLSNQTFSDVKCIKEERQALLQFKHRLIDETGRLASWVSEQNDCCKWAGIVCDSMTGHVHQIRLNGHCLPESFTKSEFEQVSKQRLRGDLSPSLLDLKQLKHLDLSCNDFGRIQVPKFIGSLGNLRYLNLSSSKFGGIIPPQLGNLSDLHTLCLGSFQDDELSESTSVVKMDWLANLRLLRHLDMSNVDLSQALDWFQEKGYKTKMKSLEDILKSMEKTKMDAKLIGYDEIPTDIDLSLANHAKDFSVERRSIPEAVHSPPVNRVKSNSSIKRMVDPTPQCSPSTSGISNGSSSQTPADKGEMLRKSSAKSHLFEICAINCWKPPLFECLEEIGPAHLKQFAFKATVALEDASNTVLECIGDHRAKKKEAADFAAQGMIWYLKKAGFLTM